ncbi:TIGR04222 domain-containing membrane protein [Saccharothrix sp. AJ9571]|nr:TIGR04222 domain-containing membrane protein [Saccharothrix sp. AJ9571]
MGDPWGLSGPAFLGIYAGCLLVPIAVLVAGLIRSHSPGGKAWRGPLDLHQAAFLRGGPRRAGEVVLAGLLERGLLRADSSGTLHHTGGSGTNQLERHMIASVTGAAGRSARALVNNVCDSGAMRALRDDLIAKGLLVDEKRRRKVCVTALALFCAVLAFGLARFAVGVAGDFPVGYLTLMLGAAIGGVITTSILMTRGEHQATKQGARARPVGFPGAAGLVAQYGLSAYPDREIRTALLFGMSPPPRSRRRNSSYGGYAGGAAVGGCSSAGGSGCSSSSGGSSCGGGGGGGCGGGGGGG